MKSYFVIAAALISVPVAAHAQPAWNPSSDELVQMLKPKASGPTRGIHAISSAPSVPESATPVSAHVSVASSQTRERMSSVPLATNSGDLASVPLRVQFENGSDRLTPAAVKTLDELGKALSSPALAAYRFRIEGHTDAVGSHDLNEALSARRAAAVSDYIANHYGVDRARLTPVGLGDSQMLIPTAEGVAEPRNRRVQIVNIGN